MEYWEKLIEMKIQEAKTRIVRSLLSETKLSIAKIAEAMEVRPYFVQKIRKQMRVKEKDAKLKRRQ